MGEQPLPNVKTVTGPVPLDSIGVTLMHEHILNDCSCWWRGHDPAFSSPIRDLPVTSDILWLLRNDPFANLQNCALDDENLAIAELKHFRGQGGQTIVDPTCRGIGRNPDALVRISKSTGLNIVMGSGYYLQSSHPETVGAMTAEDIAHELIEEHTNGVGDNAVPLGLIGEIGVSADFTPDEKKSLTGAALATVETGLPLMIHLPGWERLAHEVLNLVEGCGVSVNRVILCHMNPSFNDGEYQRSLADRGAFLEYDMIGMDFWYDDQGVQCASDEQYAAAIASLFKGGYGNRILLSQDVFLKMMLTAYGGNGYAHISRHFLPRLLRHGLSTDNITTMMVENPRCAICQIAA